MELVIHLEIITIRPSWILMCERVKLSIFLSRTAPQSTPACYPRMLLLFDYMRAQAIRPWCQFRETKQAWQLMGMVLLLALLVWLRRNMLLHLRIKLLPSHRRLLKILQQLQILKLRQLVKSKLTPRPWTLPQWNSIRRLFNTLSSILRFLTMTKLNYFHTLTYATARSTQYTVKMP